MLPSFLAGFSYGVGLSAIVCILLYVVRCVRDVPSEL